MKLSNLLILVISVIVIASLFVGCAKDLTGTTNKIGGFEISHLFNNDGCDVYRFYDDGRYHYYTNCSQTMTTESCGKNCRRGKSIKTTKREF